VKQLEWYIARRYLASRRKGRFLSLITLIAVGGIFLGVMALITVIAVMTGLQRDLQEKILGSNPHVFVFQTGDGLRLSGWRDALDRVREVPGVMAAAPFIMTHVAVTKDVVFVQAGMLYGIEPGAAGIPLSDVERAIQEGKKALGPTQSGLPGVLVGARLAEKLGARPGDTLLVASLENIKRSASGDIVPVYREFEVTGTFETGMYEYDQQNLYVELPVAQDLLDMQPDEVGGLAVNVGDPWNAQDVAREIDLALGFPFWTSDWMTLNRQLFSALKLEKLAMGVILFLIVLVAAFNIISTLIMVVTDKTREIGILKSMGMTDGRILRVFVLQGLTIGLIGTALGAAGGLALVWLLDRYEFIKLPGEVYFIDTLPVALDPVDMALILVVSLLISFTATIYPARQASRLQPVEAIRHE
jgi:lipoprotein-releasing system permease protein